MMRLAGLALRRTAPPWLLAGLVVLLVLAARAAADTEPLVAGLSDAGRRALARQNVWSLLALAAPLVWLNAARTGTAAANAWLAPQPAHPLALAAARLLGIVLAVATATLATAVIGETAVPASTSGWRRVRAEPGPAALSRFSRTGRSGGRWMKSHLWRLSRCRLEVWKWCSALISRPVR
jgi:hypothetical protein